jgi:membrane protease YdiL (CAAX protease family)
VSGEPAAPRLYTIAWAFYLVLALAGIVWIGWRGDLGPELFVDSQTWARDLAAGALGAAALLGLWAAARRGLQAARRVERHIAGLLGDVAGDEIFALAVISGIAEEIFFRGAVQGSWGWLVATALFALLHTGPSRAFRLWTLFALVAGVLFAVLTLATGNLLAAIVAHAGVNGVNLRSVAKRRSALQSADHEPDPDDSRP